MIVQRYAIVVNLVIRRKTALEADFRETHRSQMSGVPVSLGHSGKLLGHPKYAGNRFRVRDLSRHYPFDRLADRHPTRRNEFILLGPRFPTLDVSSKKKGVRLVHETRTGIVEKYLLPLPSAVSGFFHQLTLCGGQSVFALVNPTCRKLPEGFLGSVAVLANQQYAGLALAFVNTQNHDRARVPHDLPHHLHAARFHHFVTGDVEHLAPINNFGAKYLCRFGRTSSG